MTDKASQLADGLLRAIKAERDGHSFYQMAGNSTEDARAKEMFSNLAAEELDHMHFLTEHYQSVLKTGKPSETAKLGARTELTGLSPIFSDGLKTRIKEAHIEMSALSIGIQLELDAMKFYRSQADANDDPTVKSFYMELADWESGHYQALTRQQEELKEDYWSAGGFSPF